MNPSQLQNHFDAFYEDFWCEMCKYGEIEEVVVCDNNNDRELLIPIPVLLIPFEIYGSLKLLTYLPFRFDRQRLRAVQIRRLGTDRMRCT